MKISDLIKSLEKIKAKHGDLPIAFEVRNLDDGEKYLNISDMLG